MIKLGTRKPLGLLRAKDMASAAVNVDLLSSRRSRRCSPSNMKRA